MRIIMLDRMDSLWGDLTDLTSAESFGEVNGEHSLTFETRTHLTREMRALWQDGTERWHEWVIDDAEETHDGYEYDATWSMQHDLSGIPGGELWASATEGALDPISANAALTIALSPQSRWEVGDVTVQTLSAASLYDGQVWDYLGLLVDAFGGEMEPRIVVDGTGVTHRYVDWKPRIGTEDVTRRFDYGEDCTSIHRTEPSGPCWCGIVPRGGNTGTDEDGVGYTSRIGIEEAPECEGHDAGSPYLFDLEAKENFKRPDGHGGYEYPCLTVNYSLKTEGDEEELLAYALEDLHGYTRPVPTYEAEVMQFVAAGMDAHGVCLGDTVHIVDRDFGSVPLRVEARVTAIRTNLLDPSDVTLTIGNIERLEDGITSLVTRSTTEIANRVDVIEGGGTIVYLKDLLDQMNAELNVTGGYYYFVPGHGIYTYDRAVSDPSEGTEADQVTQIVGGGMRFANSRNQAGDWQWKTVIESGHIAAELVTAARIVSGYIGRPDGAVYIDLDNGVINFGAGATFGGTPVSTIMTDSANAVTTANGAAQKVDDTPIVTLSSTNGTVFKRNLGVTTTIIATIFTPGGLISDATELRRRYGSGAYLQWGWRDVVTDSDHWLVITDPRISQGGFALTVSPEDIDTQAVITCRLNA